MTLILHCGAEKVTRQDVYNVPVPAGSRSHKPVPYKDAIELLHDRADKIIGAPVRDEQYGLGREGNQLFAALTLDVGDDGRGMTIGLRQSYDKSLALGCAVGSRVLVCDNLCFSGDSFRVVRKNTVNVWRDFVSMIDEQIHRSVDHYKTVTAECDAMKALPCSLDRGFAFLGVMQGRKLLSPTQATVAFGDWIEPRHEDFADRNAWSLYNCVTEGLKKGAAAQTMQRHAQAHNFFQGEVLARAVATRPSN